MATLALAAVGSAVGGAIGGTVLGVSAAVIGQAIGSTVGGLVDQMIFGRGSSVVEGPRLEAVRIQNSTEGAPIPRIYGRMRTAGTVIWATKFRETVDESSQGGKGGGATVRQYRYSVSFALALCEGEIQRVGRIWADGKLLDTSTLTYRVHRGTSDQQPDPFMQAVDGIVPAFRGTAYIVFEDMALEAFGNRIPQLNVEVVRSVGRVGKLVKAVALSPGSGEFSLATEPARLVVREGVTTTENVHTSSGEADIIASLDQLQAEAPNCESIALVVSWFGSDLRCGACKLVPKIENAERVTEPYTWSVNGITRETAEVVSEDAQGRPIYGGTPSDQTIIQTIQEIHSRGMKVMFYPFILMDIPAGNGLADPYGRVEQPAFPWRGRITVANAGDQKTGAATGQVDAFYNELRTFVLHYASLCAQAGGVESFCIGSELRGLTQIRDTPDHYPFVDRLVTLADDVRAVLPSTKLGYAADWSEYFGHHDGNDVFFHLDPLWASANINFVGIDNYMPLSDAREASEYDLDVLKANIEGGEGFDWFYADRAARDAQNRTVIDDTAYGEDWVFRYKDLRNWWSQPHHNRPNGVRSGNPTAWVPQSKPIWFTEIGCPAVNKGANQPNVFFDPKSSESALPYYAEPIRDDFQQSRFLEASLDYWQHVNPVSSLYGAGMIDVSRTHVWTWDARPFPQFPALSDVWSDAPNYQFGHWVTGRLGISPLADVVAAICTYAGVSAIDVSRLEGMVEGFVMRRAQTARAALQELMLIYGFDGYESGGIIRFLHRGHAPTLIVDEVSEAVRSREQPRDVPSRIRLSYVDGGDYEVGASDAVTPEAGASVSETAVNIIMGSQSAQYVAERMLWEATTSRESLSGMVPLSWLRLEPSDIVSLRGESYRVDALTLGSARQMEATKIGQGIHTERVTQTSVVITPAPEPTPPLVAAFMDLPLLNETEPRLRVALFSDPWAGEAVAARDDAVATLDRPSVMGRLTKPLAVGEAGRWWSGDTLEVQLSGGALQSRERLDVLNGANAAALETPSGQWEIIQFQTAELIGDAAYRLTTMLRGQAGTEHLITPLDTDTRFVLLNGDYATLPLEVLERTYLYGAARLPLSHPSFQSAVRSFEGAGYRPYSVAHLQAYVVDSGDLLVSWIRRTRVNGDSWQGIDPPLGEDQEQYRVQVHKDGILRREAFVSSPSAVIALDGLSAPFDVEVSQLSAAYGVGPAQRLML